MEKSVSIQYLLDGLNQISNKNSRTYHFNCWLVSKEYFKSGDYVNSLEYATKVLSFYKKEGWIDLMIAVINLGIRAAYFSGNVVEFIKLGLEELGDWNKYLNEEQKVHIQHSIMDLLFEHKLPANLNFLTDNQAQQEQALNLFEENLKELKRDQQFVIKMSENVSSFIDAKVVFEKDQVYADQLVDLTVYLYLRAPEKILFDNLRVCFVRDHYNQFCIKNLNEEPLLPHKLYEFKFKIKPNPPDANQQMEIDRLELSLGCLENSRIICEWTFKSNSFFNFFSNYNSNSSLIQDSDKLKFKYIQNRTSTFLNFKQPLVDFSIEHNESCLFDENFAFKLNLVNNELDDLRNLDLFIRQFKEQNDYEELLNEFACVDCDLQVFDSAKFIKIQLTKCLKKGEQLNKNIFMRAKTPANLILDFSLSYFVKAIDHHTESNNTVYHTCTLKRTVNLNTYFPFENLFLIQNLLKTNDSYWPKALEPFFLQIKLISNSSIQINSVEFLLNTNNFVLEDYGGDLADFNKKTSLNKKCFQPGEELVEFVKLHCKHESTMKLNLGVLILRWKRLDDKLSISPLNETRILLPEFTVKPSLVFIESNFPTFGYIKKRFDVEFKIFNRTENYLPMMFTIEDNINFLYSGNKQKKINIEPKSFWIESVSFLPMFCGFLRLPKIKLIAYPNTMNAMDLNDTIDEILPSFLKILPKY